MSDTIMSLTTKFAPASAEMWATLLVALSGILYGFLGFFGTKLLRDANFDVFNMLFWRFLTASVWISAYSFFQKEKLFNHCSNLSTFLTILLIGTICYSGGAAFYFLASARTGTGPAMVIFFSFPVFVAFFSWLTGKWKVNSFAVCALLAIVSGLFLLRGQGETSLSILGISFAILSALCYAIYVINSKNNIGAIHSSLWTILICFGSTLVFFAITISTHAFSLPNSLQAWIDIFILGIFATAIPIQLVLHGLKIISSLKASIISVLEPVVTSVVGVVLLDESITLVQVMGIVVILVGAVLIQFEKS